MTEADGHLVRKGEGGVSGVQTVNVRLGVVRHVPVVEVGVQIKNWNLLGSDRNREKCQY